jgi:hypothetical protein
MDESKEPYRLYDNKEKAFVNMKNYKSWSSATRSADKRNQEYGTYRYSAEKFSDIVNRNAAAQGGGGGGSGRLGGRTGLLGSPVGKLPEMAKGGLARKRPSAQTTQKPKTPAKKTARFR